MYLFISQRKNGSFVIYIDMCVYVETYPRQIKKKKIVFLFNDI